MRRQVRIAKAAERDLTALDRDTLRRVGKVIDDLARDPRPQGCEKLAGSQDLYRLRTGSYRVVYRIRHRELLVLVVAVGHRRDIYEKLRRRR